ncbi:MAG: DUF2179 domain-containing protein [Phycisphaerae bacterium]|nr:DUF2179 domain-containing protein [Gemmatimonadaceae bacterium]
MPDLDLLFASQWGALMIFGLRIIDVSLETMRVIFTIRGRRDVAAILGFFVAMVWIFAVGNAVKHLDSWVHIVGYAGGFAAGTFIGITIERLLAYGVAMVRVVSQYGGVEIAHALRQRGYGVTEIAGFGREGTVEILESAVQRQHLGEVLALIDQWDTNAFVTIAEPKVLRGGSILRRDPTASAFLPSRPLRSPRSPDQ